MEKCAIVKFIGIENNYLFREQCNEFLYCRDCDKIKFCKKSKSKFFVKDKKYEVYFLDYCQGNRNVVEIRAENDKILTYVSLSDFEIVSDIHGILKNKYALVKCVNTNKNFDLTLGKQYVSLKCDVTNEFFYVLDNSFDCYYYPKNCFEIVSDDNNLLKS